MYHYLSKSLLRLYITAKIVVEKCWLFNINSLIRPFKLFLKIISQIIFLGWKLGHKKLLIVILLTIPEGVLPVISAWLIKSIMDILTIGITNVANTSKYFYSLINYLVIYIFVLIISALVPLISRSINTDIMDEVSLYVQNEICKKVSGFEGIEYFENSKFHDLLQLGPYGAQYGANAVQDLVDFIKFIILLFGYMGGLVVYNPLVAAMVLFTSIPQLLISLKLAKQRYDLSSGQAKDQRWLSYYLQALTGKNEAAELRLYNLADFFLKRFSALSKSIILNQQKQRYRENFYQFILNGLSTFIYGVVYYLLIISVYNNLSTVGDIALYTAAVNGVQGGLSSIIFIISNMSEKVLYYSKYKELIETPQPIHVTSNPLSVPALTKGIEFRGVSFRYSSNQNLVLNNVNLFIPAGKCMALVGVNGAGKTSLIKLLSRLYDPIAGEIYWDGVDIKKFSPDDLRKQLGVITQEFIHYPLRFSENIGIGDIKRVYDLSNIKKSTQKAGLEGVVGRLPKHYHTVLSMSLDTENQGGNLSGGEWQKVAIARLFFRNAPILVLDEPTSAIDAESEHKLLKGFNELMKGRTSILISHRLNAVRQADIISVLENGQIIEMGSHGDLLRLGGKYATMFALQAEKYSFEAKG